MSFETILARVRELSENATLRPAPNMLRCVPWRPFEIKAVDAFKQRMDRKIKIRMMLSEMAAAL